MSDNCINDIVDSGAADIDYPFLQFGSHNDEKEPRLCPFFLQCGEDMAKMRTLSEETMHRIKQNDPSLNQLRIGSTNNDINEEDNNITMKYIREFAKLGTLYLGSYISENTHLTSLQLKGDTFYESNNRAECDDSEFYNGLKNNSSITELIINGYEHSIFSGAMYTMPQNIVGGVVQEILQVYQINSSHLTRLDIQHVSIIENGAVALFVDTLRNCTNLMSIAIQHCYIHEEQMVQIVEVISGHHVLRDLQLNANAIGLRGCQAIGTLLQDPNCNLRSLDLSGNAITADRGVGFGDDTYVPFSIIEDIFITSLCDKSSINRTYLSNHMLTNLDLLDVYQRGDTLTSLLRMNKSSNKSHVAIRKILKFQPNVFSDMQPFFADWISDDDEQSLKALPYIIDWLNKAARITAQSSPDMIYQYKNIKLKKLSAIYEFARTMPVMFVTDIDVTYIVQVQENDHNTIEAKLPQQKDMIRGVASDKCCLIQ